MNLGVHVHAVCTHLEIEWEQVRSPYFTPRSFFFVDRFLQTSTLEWSLRMPHEVVAQPCTTLTADAHAVVDVSISCCHHFQCNQQCIITWKHRTLNPTPPPRVKTGAVRVNVHMRLCVIMCVMFVTEAYVLCFLLNLLISFPFPCQLLCF